MNTQSCQVGIHQPNFAPWLGYFYKINQADKFVFLDNVAIELNSQQAFVNRTKVKIQSGTAWLTCPVSRVLSPSKLITDVLFDPNQNWKKKITRTIYYNYKKSKHFDEIYPLLENLIDVDIQQLSVFNINIIKTICDYINIKTPFFIASELKLESSEKNNRIVEICKKLDASSYLSGKGGLKYHDTSMFIENGLSINDLNFKHPIYPQLYGDFVSGLSIIDVLFNCGKQDTFNLININGQTICQLQHLQKN